MARVLKHWLNLAHSHAIGQILFVGQQQQRHSGQVVILYHSIENSFRFIGPLSVVRVYHIDQGMALFVVLEKNKR